MPGNLLLKLKWLCALWSYKTEVLAIFFVPPSSSSPIRMAFDYRVPIILDVKMPLVKVPQYQVKDDQIKPRVHRFCVVMDIQRIYDVATKISQRVPLWLIEIFP